MQRHPDDAGALAAGPEVGQEPADPWRDPAAAAAMGTPAFEKPVQSSPTAALGKLGVRDVIFGGRVSYAALAVLAITALVIGIAGLSLIHI